MNTKQNKFDKISCTILTAFILMGGVHFNCRYNIVPLVDTFFHQVSAQPVMPDAPVPAPLTQAPVVAASYAGNPENTTVLVHKSVARNPFAVPMAARPQDIAYTPAYNANTTTNGLRTATGNNEPMIERTVLALRGIVQSGNKSMALIEYDGVSKAYAIGQTIGNYTLESIADNSVSLDGDVIYIGGSI